MIYVASFTVLLIGLNSLDDRNAYPPDKSDDRGTIKDGKSNSCYAKPLAFSALFYGSNYTCYREAKSDQREKETYYRY